MTLFLFGTGIKLRSVNKTQVFCFQAREGKKQGQKQGAETLGEKHMTRYDNNKAAVNSSV